MGLLCVSNFLSPLFDMRNWSGPRDPSGIEHTNGGLGSLPCHHRHLYGYEYAAATYSFLRAIALLLSTFDSTSPRRSQDSASVVTVLHYYP